MYSKRVQIDAGVNIMRALSCLDQFIKLYVHLERSKRPIFFGDAPNMIAIY